jgi:hypothetical protein
MVRRERQDGRLDFVADVGASGLVPEVVRGKLRGANEHESYVGDAEWGRSPGERT